jgi:hypothetical protein
MQHHYLVSCLSETIKKGFSIYMRIFLLMINIGIFASVNSQNFVSPTVITTFSSELNETSGLINLNGEIWTHTDNGGKTELYLFDTSDGNIIRTVDIKEANNTDWEDIAFDESYVYIGDFGNNYGSRTNLNIYRIKRQDLASSNEVEAKKIEFSYSNQTSFEPSYHNTNFDCEAMISAGDKLFLFTKNWIDNQTNVYKLPNKPGEHTAEYLFSFDVGCLISGAEWHPSLNNLYLIGYNQSGGSYTWVFRDFSGTDFFSGNSIKLIWTSLTQIEGICMADASGVYVSSEKFGGELDPTLYYLNLSGFMNVEPEFLPSGITVTSDKKRILVQTNNNSMLTGELQVFDFNGKVVYEKIIMNENYLEIPIKISGLYMVVFNGEKLNFSIKTLVF